MRPRSLPRHGRGAARALWPLLGLLCGLAAGRSAGAAEPGPGYPTLARVVHVQACMDEHPGPRFEMQSKCACAFDTLASALTPDEFDELSTSSQALSIGGERGSVLRDNPQAQAQARHYRTLQAQAQQHCLLARPSPRP